ncbi:MAG: pyrroline-5-carboxylate reductase [Leptospiraceae bacterium]|nr:pyrroline-5-carboxylate reductase [Leptospiraceae bacterium]
MSEKKKLAIIGLGNMGKSIFHFIQHEFKIVVYDPFYTLEKDRIDFVGSLKEATEFTNTILLCVKPDQITPTLTECASKPINVLSIAAGITIEKMQLVSHKETKIVRLMPNLPLVIGEAAIGYYGDKSLHTLVEEIFSRMGKLVLLSNEKLMNAVTGLSGSGPAFVFSFIQALAEGGVKSGLPYKDALELAIQTVKGASEFLESELSHNANTHPMQLRNKVTSPGGTTIFGLEQLEKGNFHASVMNAVYTANLRAFELGK